MRSEFCVALAASLALHAGLVMLAPAARSAAAPDTEFRPQLTARLELSAAPARTWGSRRLESGGAPRASGLAPAAYAHPSRRSRAAQAGSPDPRRFYPREAIEKGLEGEAIVMLWLDDNGQLLDAQIAKSSGYTILDLAALRAVRAAPRFAPGPQEILFPVTFTLH